MTQKAALLTHCVFFSPSLTPDASSTIKPLNHGMTPTVATTQASAVTTTTYATVGSRVRGSTLARKGSRMMSTRTGSGWRMSVLLTVKYSAAAETRRKSTEESFSELWAQTLLGFVREGSGGESGDDDGCRDME